MVNLVNVMGMAVVVKVVKMTGLVVVLKVLKVTISGSGQSGKSDGFVGCCQFGESDVSGGCGQ